MPEISEYKIVSEFINKKSNCKFKAAYNVERGNLATLFDKNIINDDFTINSESNGKELIINIIPNNGGNITIYVFMGMTGNWKWVKTIDWNNTRFVRLRFDDDQGNSLLLYGGYMGPKYSIGKKFTGTKRGPDPTKQFMKFKENIITNINKKSFDKSICEVLLNQEYFNGIGAYMCSEIVGRLDFNPFMKFKDLNSKELEQLFHMTKKCCEESYLHGGAELKDWQNPSGPSEIHKWLMFYNNKDICYKQKFPKRNIWINKKWLNS